MPDDARQLAMRRFISRVHAGQPFNTPDVTGTVSAKCAPLMCSHANIRFFQDPAPLLQLTRH